MGKFQVFRKLLSDICQEIGTEIVEDAIIPLGIELYMKKALGKD